MEDLEGSNWGEDLQKKSALEGSDLERFPPPPHLFKSTSSFVGPGIDDASNIYLENASGIYWWVLGTSFFCDLPLGKKKVMKLQQQERIRQYRSRVNLSRTGLKQVVHCAWWQYMTSHNLI